MQKKTDFLHQSHQVLNTLYDWLQSHQELSLKSLPVDRTAFIVVDMVNGFAKEGAMYSARIGSINNKIAALCRRCQQAGIPLLAFADCHSLESPEFSSYPVHCLSDSIESQLTEELQCAGKFTTILKNSTNGFLEPIFARWLQEHPLINCFVVVGDCTDICISQFVTTLKADFNRQNRTSRVIVPFSLVETYDAPMHKGDLANLMSLYFMSLNGVELCSNILE